MLRFFLFVIPLLLFWNRNWLTVAWIDFQNILPCWPELKGQYAFNTAKTITRVIYLLYIVYYVIYYFFFQNQYRMLWDRVTNFMVHYKVPKPTQDRVLRSYQQARSNNKIKFPISHIGLHILPQVLRRTVISYAEMTMLEKLKMFHQSFQLLTAIVTKVSTEKYFSGDIVCKKGTVADKLYIVVFGILEARTAAGQHLENMSPGDIVGEIGVFHIDGYNTRTANVKSVSDSEVIAINKEDVDEIINKFPEAKKLMLSIGKRRLRRSKTLYL